MFFSKCYILNFFSLLESSTNSSYHELEVDNSWHCDCCDSTISVSPIERLQHRQECAKKEVKGEKWGKERGEVGSYTKLERLHRINLMSCISHECLVRAVFFSKITCIVVADDDDLSVKGKELGSSRKPNSKPFECVDCGRTLHLTPIEILKHRKLHSAGTSKP